LGGNVLSQFRVEVDYPEQLCFFERSGEEQANDFDTVGLVLDTNSSGQLVVRAVSSTASAVTRQNIQPGDVILQIGDSVDGPYTLTKAAQSLSGVVGERKRLRILRRREPMNVTVVVSRIL
jgi:C-terminal processing protease CtpA/Prc